MPPGATELSPKTLLFLTINLLVVGLDQLTKWWVRGNIELNRERIEVIPGFFQLVHVSNTGAAGGLLGGYEHRMWVFLLFTLVACAVLVSMLRELEPGERVMSATLGLIMGGAIGNAIDRLHKQSVTDFLRFYTDQPDIAAWLRSSPLGAAEYPSFNVADVAIVVGVLTYITLYLVGYGPALDKREPPSS